VPSVEERRVHVALQRNLAVAYRRSRNLRIRSPVEADGVVPSISEGCEGVIGTLGENGERRAAVAELLADQGGDLTEVGKGKGGKVVRRELAGP
jgi:hypothetical protein